MGGIDLCIVCHPIRKWTTSSQMDWQVSCEMRLWGRAFVVLPDGHVFLWVGWHHWVFDKQGSHTVQEYRRWLTCRLGRRDHGFVSILPVDQMFSSEPLPGDWCNRNEEGRSVLSLWLWRPILLQQCFEIFRTGYVEPRDDYVPVPWWMGLRTRLEPHI